MKYTRKRYSRNKRQHKSKHRSKHQSKHRSKHRSKDKSRRRLKQRGGGNDLIQLGYNTTRGMTSTIKNFINTFIGNTPTPSPQATKSQYSR